MNEVIKALLERRSIRQFAPEPIDSHLLNLILKAALYAPSARASQATHLTALTNPEKIAELDQAVKAASRQPGFDKYAAFVSRPEYSINFNGAPVFIIAGAHREDAFCPAEDGALVLAQLMLAAHSLDLGSCWVNQLAPIGEEPGFRARLTALGFPATHLVIGCLALGRREGANPSAQPRKEGRINTI